MNIEPYNANGNSFVRIKYNKQLQNKRKRMNKGIVY